MVGLFSGPTRSEASVSLGDSVRQLSSELTGEAEPSAPISLPSRSDLTVRLVDVALLRRLDELRDDLALVQGAFWTIAGALLGVVASGLTSSNAMTDQLVWTVVGILLMFLILIGFFWFRTNKRASTARARIFGEIGDPDGVGPNAD